MRYFEYLEKSLVIINVVEVKVRQIEIHNWTASTGAWCLRLSGCSEVAKTKITRYWSSIAVWHPVVWPELTEMFEEKITSCTCRCKLKFKAVRPSGNIGIFLRNWADHVWEYTSLQRGFPTLEVHRCALKCSGKRLIHTAVRTWNVTITLKLRRLWTLGVFPRTWPISASPTLYSVFIGRCKGSYYCDHSSNARHRLLNVSDTRRTTLGAGGGALIGQTEKKNPVYFSLFYEYVYEENAKYQGGNWQEIV